MGCFSALGLFLAINFKPCHFPLKNEFSNQKHCVSGQTHILENARVSFPQGVRLRQLHGKDEISTEYGSYECFMSPCQAYLLCLCNLIAKAFTQLAEHCHFDILGDGCELAFYGLSMRGLLFSVPRSQEREFDCFWTHRIGLRSKQKNESRILTSQVPKKKANVNITLATRYSVCCEDSSGCCKVWDEVVCHLEQRNSNVMFFFCACFYCRLSVSVPC